MKRVIVFIITLLTLSSCTSIMMNMMEEEMEVVFNDSLSKADKAGVMLPICFENILQTVDDDKMSQCLTDMVNKIILNGYSHLPVEDATKFNPTIKKIVEEL